MSQKRLGFIEISYMIIHNMILTHGVDDVSKIWDLIKVYDS
ncbi:MAG TPA: hypothetical protein VJ599_04545 [Nitrososphaeraceae archaeon]|jgi:hypothetical protein|nr:hypothetical protein [Nitrososphaeraceae archaeon]